MSNFSKFLFYTGSLLFLTTILNAQTIPSDPALRTGKLPNGFTYFIRRNAEPAKLVQFYLVNKAGSILEDEDQLGLAHFMEHMNFNGTKHFPKNELVNFLQKNGVQFGADLNAYTSFDETVYQLPIPTDNQAMFSSGLRVMRDWAQEALLDSSEIEKERGIVLEEERLGKGANDRMSRKYYPVLLNHARYAERLPIGTDAILTKFKPAAIKRFYHDWYRPDLQGLIIVGDLNVDETEALIKAQFSDLKNPVNERLRTDYQVPLTGKIQFLTVTDKEETAISLEILMKHKAGKVVTEQDYIQQLKVSLFNNLIHNRNLAELAQKSNPPYSGINAAIAPLLGGLDMFDFNLKAKQGKLPDAFAMTWQVIERVKRYGFTQDELETVIQNLLRRLETEVNEQDKTSSINYVKEYQNLFLHNEAAPGINWEYQFTKNHIHAITLVEINQLIADYLGSKDIDILISAPESEKANLPDSAAVSGWMSKISSASTTRYHGDDTIRPLLTKLPAPGKIVYEKTIPSIGSTEIRLSNGVRVILKNTAFKNDQILYSGYCAGGTSLYDNSDFDMAANASGIIGSFGLGNLNPVQLTKSLTGKIAGSTVQFGIRTQNVSGSSAVKDLETALQLTYLQFTAPRKDTLLFRNILNAAKEKLATRYADPNQVFADTISYVLGNYSYRSAAPTKERLDKINLDRTYEIYRNAFADAAGFTFVFVGNFKMENIRPLLERYLGSLPSNRKNIQARDLNNHIPNGQLEKLVYKGSENKAIVRMVISGDYKYSSIANLQLKALCDILQIKLLQHLRESESEVYSPQVQSIYSKYPKSRFLINISFGCAPENIQHLIALANQEIQALQGMGPEQEDIDKFKAAYEKNIELALKDNSFWLTYLLGQFQNNENPIQINELISNLAKIDAPSLKKAGEVFLSNENLIKFELLPQKN